MGGGFDFTVKIRDFESTYYLVDIDSGFIGSDLAFFQFMNRYM